MPLTCLSLKCLSKRTTTTKVGKCFCYLTVPYVWHPARIHSCDRSNHGLPICSSTAIRMKHSSAHSFKDEDSFESSFMNPSCRQTSKPLFLGSLELGFPPSSLTRLNSMGSGLGRAQGLSWPPMPCSASWQPPAASNTQLSSISGCCLYTSLPIHPPMSRK